jgi:hypothetical protein
MHTNKGQDYFSLYCNLQAFRLEMQKKEFDGMVAGIP